MPSRVMAKAARPALLHQNVTRTPALIAGPEALPFDRVAIGDGVGMPVALSRLPGSE